ncbi:hypothetical protein TanjilG_11054 [Lupinus angustifolius]|uniref:Uncharacterized protein n=1 Tax=Lupinus angustifolius TaxID=3871 RepID=A0A1J7IA01_LUPAN|nr:hypothetical protein TanjilG_11054 [Lupinus angustifolius]
MVEFLHMFEGYGERLVKCRRPCRHDDWRRRSWVCPRGPFATRRDYYNDDQSLAIRLGFGRQRRRLPPLELIVRIFMEVRAPNSEPLLLNFPNP